jgi:hypothetical protein
MNAKILFRDGDVFLTEIDACNTPESLAQRMVAPTGGFVVCRDTRWNKARVIVVNLADVKAIELEEE